MPLTKRAVSPVHVSRGRLPDGVQRDELQCVANGTIANLIRQLSSLSKHAEHICGEICHDAMKLDHKTNTLQQRMDRLLTKVTQLDSNNEQASLDELQMRKQFKSSCLVDQHTLDRATLPNALSEGYSRCDPPPNLDALNPYRDDPNNALSLYTNPSFFFDLWRQEMLKDCGEGRRRMKSPGANTSPKKKKNRPPGQTQVSGAHPLQQVPDAQRQHSNRYMSSLRSAPVGVLSFPEEYQAPQALGLQLGGYSQQHKEQPLPPPPASLLPPPGMSLPPAVRSVGAPARAGQSLARDLPPPDMALISIDDEDDDLPPPPPPLIHTSIVQHMPSPPESAIQFVPPQDSQAVAVPPPPPPPPPPPLAPPPPTATSFGGGSARDAEAERAVGSNRDERAPDTRSNLLAEIQSGIKLKKVRLAEEAAASNEMNDVAAILKRRMEQIMGRDEDSQSSGSVEADEWDD